MSISNNGPHITFSVAGMSVLMALGLIASPSFRSQQCRVHCRVFAGRRAFQLNTARRNPAFVAVCIDRNSAFGFTGVQCLVDQGKDWPRSGNASMVFREGAHIQLNWLVDILAARVSCASLPRKSSISDHPRT
jgi:hypothetical protein